MQVLNPVGASMRSIFQLLLAALSLGAAGGTVAAEINKGAVFPVLSVGVHG